TLKVLETGHKVTAWNNVSGALTSSIEINCLGSEGIGCLGAPFKVFDRSPSNSAEAWFGDQTRKAWFMETVSHRRFEFTASPSVHCAIEMIVCAEIPPDPTIGISCLNVDRRLLLNEVSTYFVSGESGTITPLTPYLTIPAVLNCLTYHHSRCPCQLDKSTIL